MKISLDFNIDKSQDRLKFIQDYTENSLLNFTNDNLEMMANYILWAIEKEENIDFQIDSKNSQWIKKRETSLEALMEQEQETGMPVESLFKQNLLNKKPKIDREHILKKLNPSITDDFFTKIVEHLPLEIDLSKWHPLTQSWFDLWGKIDITEYEVQYWELLHGKRRADLPIRQELIDRLYFHLCYSKNSDTLETFLEKLQQNVHNMNGYTHLKKKRELVILRTEQYLLLDAIQPNFLQKHMNTGFYWEEDCKGIDEFFPFMEEKLLLKEITEECFKKDFQNICLKELMYSDCKKNNKIDLRDTRVVREILLNKQDLEKCTLSISDREITERLLKFLKYYVDKCEFSEELLLIMNLKSLGISNKEIAQEVKKKFNIEYQENYISTIFTKRIVAAIAEQAELHYKIVEYITMGKNVFKRCSICKQLLPRNGEYFNKRSSTSDGFFSYCKKCKKQRK